MGTTDIAEVGLQSSEAGNDTTGPKSTTSRRRGKHTRRQDSGKHQRRRGTVVSLGSVMEDRSSTESEDVMDVESFTMNKVKVDVPKVQSFLCDARMVDVHSWAAKLEVEVRKRIPILHGGLFKKQESCSLALTPGEFKCDPNLLGMKSELDRWCRAELCGWKAEDAFTQGRTQVLSIPTASVKNFRLRTSDILQRTVNICHGSADDSIDLVFASAAAATSWCSALLMFLTALRDAEIWQSSLENRLCL